MSYNKKELADIFRDMFTACGSGYNGMSPATLKGFLPQITDLLKCNKDKHWRKLCFDIDNQKAQYYLELTPKELIHYNGMSLKDWKEEDITRKDVLVALDSNWHKLTPSAVKSNKKISKHLTNNDILRIAKKQLYYIHDYKHNRYDLINPYWLECLKLNNKSFLDNNLATWIKYLGIVYWFIPREEYKQFADKLTLLKKLKAPDVVIQYASQLCSFALRYQGINPDRDYTKKEYVPLSADVNENAEFEVYLKMKGTQWNKEWTRRLDFEQHYQNNLFALNECLIAKYSNNKRKEQII